MSDPKREARIIALDIETYRDVPMELFAELVAGVKPRGGTKDPLKIERQIREKRDAIMGDAALSPLTGRVACWAVYDGTDDGMACTVRELDDEREALLGLDRLLARSGATYIATKNGRKFDLPFIAARYALHGIVPEFPLPLGHHRRHIDIQDVFTEKLGLWATRFGYVKTAKGSDVAGMVAAEEWERLVQYNLMDAKITWELATRLLPILKG